MTNSSLRSLLLLFFGLVAAESAITDAEIKEIYKGINVTKEFGLMLPYNHPYMEVVLDKLLTTYGPYVDAFSHYSELLLIYSEENADHVVAMKAAFEDINDMFYKAELDMIPVENMFDWTAMSVDFQDIEADIKLLEKKLREVLGSSSADHGRAEYVRTYETWYKDAGSRLYESIVKYENIPSHNLLNATELYTERDSNLVNDFTEGLIVLLLRAAAVELAYEKCKEHDRGMVGIWKERIADAEKAMQRADDKTNSWKDFAATVDEMAQDLAAVGEASFGDQVFIKLRDSYPWRYWVVNSISRACTAAVGYDDPRVYYRFKYFDKSYVVASVAKSSKFNKVDALADIKETKCITEDSLCFNEPDRVFFDLLPNNHGIMKMVSDNTCAWHIDYNNAERYAEKHVYLVGETKRQIFKVAYFG